MIHEEKPIKSDEMLDRAHAMRLHPLLLARVAELADARDLKSLGAELCTGSSPVSGTALKPFFNQF
jgi:hypothetical protein